MPKIIEYFGLVFYFYANEHEPIHVHVSYAEYETIFDLYFENGEIIEIRSRFSKGIPELPVKKKKMAINIIRIYSEDIVRKWMDFFVMNKKPEVLKITTKL